MMIKKNIHVLCTHTHTIKYIYSHFIIIIVTINTSFKQQKVKISHSLYFIYFDIII